MAEAVRRRRRVRPVVEDGPAPEPAAADEPTWTDADLAPVERGLRGLVGGGSSQVTPQAAMRARDSARPRPEDLARAEAELTIVRRHWTPRDGA